MFPLTALSLVLLVAAACMLPSTPVDIASQTAAERPEPKKLAVYLVLFMICLGCVSHLIPYPVMLVLVLITLLFINRTLFQKADYFLLLTFVFFFLFIGNVQNIPAVSDLLHKLIRGRELDVYKRQLVDHSLIQWNVNPVIHSLVMDGIFNGVGSVLSFLPVIVTLFFFLSLLELSLIHI